MAILVIKGVTNGIFVEKKKLFDDYNAYGALMWVEIAGRNFVTNVIDINWEVDLRSLYNTFAT